MDGGAPYGVAAWSSPEWRRSVTRWLDERLAAGGVRRTGDVEQPRVRPWSTVLRASTTAGTVWLKAAARSTGFEVPLYELLARTVPERVLTPIATDARRGWMVLPDGGPSLGERLSGAAQVDALAAAIVQYGRLQRTLEPHVDALLAAGVADMRPTAIPARFDTELEASGVRRADPELHARLVALRPRVVAWCERLDASPLAPSLDHNDLHPFNILGDPSRDAARYYDWGDSVVAHPFAATLVPLAMVRRGLDATPADPRLLRARDAYLDVFADRAPRAELVALLEIACRVAKIARAAVWARALRSAQEQGEPLDPTWAAAPVETLASLLDDAWLGGA